MGDIDLRHEIQVNYRGVGKRARVRRIYSARVEGQNRGLTVAAYQGDGAEEKWRQDIAKYMSMRHPNIVQIYGTASSNGIHAALFNDAPMLHLTCRKDQDFWKAFNYLFSAFQREFWIRHSTGQLCVELTPASDNLWLGTESFESPALSGIYSLSADTETITMFINSLTLKQYHYICRWNLAQNRPFDLFASTTVDFGTVFHDSSDRLESLVEIAFLPSAEAPRISHWTNHGGGARERWSSG
ncbi:hypothetical protein GGX14DRAFT_403121 [Mycena pura]|uniref:Protein kinase domain-containing protein n=1 Tax=Mycena pura TaxID=153505 RepID=A0AAD6V0T4_9AGAR|nr:hypothetical protein GGX14DRAFT_403121 [Mycena pura]